MSYYKDIFFVICLFIFLSSANSLRRQVTDDFITKWRPSEEVGPVPYIDNGGLNPMSTKISSSSSDSKSKVSAFSSGVKGLRDDPPSSYSLKMESFTTLLKSKNVERYESRPFTVGGYNWTLIVYPNGNKYDNGAGSISLYVAINESNLVPPNQEVYADLTFYIYNNIHKKYFTIQDFNVWRFNTSKTMLGFSRVMSIHIFYNHDNGYLFDNDHCEFGVDINIQSLFQKSELFDVNHDFQTRTFNWSVEEFSKYINYHSLSQVFDLGGRQWSLRFYPRGDLHGEEGEYFSLSLYLDVLLQKLKPYEKIYARFKLRLLDQIQANHVERTIENWFNNETPRWVLAEFMLLSDVIDPNNGFVLNDVLKLQVEIEEISATTYLPDDEPYPSLHFKKKTKLIKHF